MDEGSSDEVVRDTGGAEETPVYEGLKAYTEASQGQSVLECPITYKGLDLLILYEWESGADQEIYEEDDRLIVCNVFIGEGKYMHEITSLLEEDDDLAIYTESIVRFGRTI